MKFFYALFVAAVLAIPSMTASAIDIDGVADTAYGSAISTQQIGTVALDNNYGNQGIANGSELDAAYGFVSNGVLYLVMAGNFNSLPTVDGGTSPNDYLNIFFMTGAGGDQTLGTNYSATYSGRINRMGVGANNTDPSAPGLTFDTDFAANYWIGINVGLDEPQNPGNTMFVDYQVVCSNCASAFLGSVASTNSPPLVLTNVYFGSTIQVSLNNTNLFGVDATSCYTNASGAAQSVAAAAVRTGAELAIPLGALGNPTGDVYICSFITTKVFDTMYNQVLGAVWDGTSTYCQSYLAGGDPAYVNFSTIPGTNYFKVTVPPCDVILVNPTTASYASTGGVGSVTVANSGGCAITVTTNASWLSVTSSSGLGSGNGSFTYSVSSNSSSINSRTGQFIISNTAPSGNIVTQTVTITQTGIPSPPLSSTFTIDGIAEAAYGCPLTVQQIETQFGDSIGTNLMSNGGGSELDAAYGMIENGVLFLVLAGNLENNFNRLDIFFMTGPGGQNTLTNVNPSIDFNGLNTMGYSTNPAGAGLTFHTGFAPNYWISVNGGSIFGGPYTFYVNYAQLVQGGTNSGAVGYYLGSTTITNGTLIGGTNPFGIQGTINDSNTNGVDGGLCPTNGLGGVQSELAATVRTGIELGIPLTALGSPTGAIAVVAFVNNGDHTYMSNQMLPSLVTNACQGNLGITGPTRTINLNNYAGEASFLVGPEMRITSINRSGNAINVSYQTEAITNLTYRLQFATTLTTNTTWQNVVGAPANIGTGGIITDTDTSGATNSPGRFYRVRQIPGCQ